MKQTKNLITLGLGKRRFQGDTIWVLFKLADSQFPPHGNIIVKCNETVT